jgi:opacity protein-like surface antigen
MSNTTSGSGDSQRTENEFEPGVIAQYWFGEPNDVDFVPFVWGGFRNSNSSSGSGEYKSSRSGLTYGGGGGLYMMLAENIALTPIFEYSMGKHNSKAGEYSSTASYSTTQILIGLSFLK